jgi:hypothetical protein
MKEGKEAIWRIEKVEGVVAQRIEEGVS